MNDPKQILRSASRVLLVDWPNTTVPRTLVAAGFHVFGSSPAGYSEADIIAHTVLSSEGVTVFPPMDASQAGYLRFRRLRGTPGNVDVVYVYRPEEELESIVEQYVLRLHASALWLQPSQTSLIARDLAEKHGFSVIEGIEISDIARSIQVGK